MSRQATPPPLRSDRWLAGANVSGLLHRSSLRAGGAGSTQGPVIGICNSWSQLVHCNVHFRSTAHIVAEAVREAGGIPVEFPTISLSENLMKPTAMLYRNLMSMDVEESIRAHPLDAVVLLGSCDKTVPAQVMGAISAGVPAICLTGGPSEPAHFRGRELGVGTDLWKFTDDVRAGRMSMDEYAQLETALIPSHGHCNEMGTASTMAAIVEALGLTLPGAAFVPAMHADRRALAAAVGRRAVELARAGGPCFGDLVTADALDNAIIALMAIGGSTNAVVHLLAIAGRAGVPLPLERFAELSAKVPLLVDVRPSGSHLANDMLGAGGLPAVLRQLSDVVALDAPTVDGRTIGAALDEAPEPDGRVIAARDAPIGEHGAIALLRGSLAPRGALIKRSAATAGLLQHRGKVIVFDSLEQLNAQIDDPDLPVDPSTVLVLRNAGPVGGPGMPEWGMLPIPAKLLAEGVADLVRISDARMSGTAFGTVVLHVAPEAAVGGPLGLLRDGDEVVLDVDAGRIDIAVPEDELARRTPAPPAHRTPRRGYERLYAEHVLQADEGCDFDFLRGIDTDHPGALPTGLFSGWLGGW